MLNKVLADVVVVIHLAFVLFVVAGGLLVLRWRWAPWLHLPAAAWGAAVEFFGWFCPLTPLENWLRRAGNTATYSESFLERYLLPVLYPAQLTRELQIFLGSTVVVINLVIYVYAWHRRRTAK